MRTCILAATAALVALGVVACRKSASISANGTQDAVMAPGSTWDVYKDGRKVEEIQNEPGVETTLAPPSQSGVKTPAPEPTYLTGTYLDAFEADALAKLRKQATSFEGYVALLRKSGYEVKPKP